MSLLYLHLRKGAISYSIATSRGISTGSQICFCWASLSDLNYTSTAEAPATFQGIFPAQSLPGAQTNMELHSTWGAQQLP